MPATGIRTSSSLISGSNSLVPCRRGRACGRGSGRDGRLAVLLLLAGAAGARAAPRAPPGCASAGSAGSAAGRRDPAGPAASPAAGRPASPAAGRRPAAARSARRCVLAVLAAVAVAARPRRGPSFSAVVGGSAPSPASAGTWPSCWFSSGASPCSRRWSCWRSSAMPVIPAFRWSAAGFGSAPAATSSATCSAHGLVDRGRLLGLGGLRRRCVGARLDRRGGLGLAQRRRARAGRIGDGSAGGVDDGSSGVGSGVDSSTTGAAGSARPARDRLDGRCGGAASSAGACSGLTASASSVAAGVSVV